MISPFPPELRTLAFVPRWNIVFTSLKDNVAAHSYYVMVYSFVIARTIGWKGPPDFLFMNAAMHDNDESITGDITGPVKTAIVDADKAFSVLQELSEDRMGGLMQMYYDMEDEVSPAVIKEADAIVHAADKLDAVLFLIMNQRMGNSFVEPALLGGMKSLEGSWRALPVSKDVIDRTWQTVMLPAIEEHKVRGGRGCAPGVRL